MSYRNHMSYTNPDYDHYVAISDQIIGWLSPAERDALLIAGLLAWKDYAIFVELGSFQGKSTVILGGIIKVKGSGRLYAVDPHEGGLSYPDQIINGGLSGAIQFTQPPTLDAFNHNLLTADLTGVVDTVRLKSTEFDLWPKVDLLFIDALHDEASVRADWNYYMPRLNPNAIVAWHDYGEWQGVTATVDDLIARGTINKILQGDSMIITQFLGLK